MFIVIIFRAHNFVCELVRNIIICVAFFRNRHFFPILYLLLRFTKEEAVVQKHALPLSQHVISVLLTLYLKLFVFYHGGSGHSKILRYIRILTIYPK